MSNSTNKPDTTTNSNRPTREQMREASKLAKQRRRMVMAPPKDFKPGQTVTYPGSKTKYLVGTGGQFRRIN